MKPLLSSKAPPTATPTIIPITINTAESIIAINPRFFSPFFRDKDPKIIPAIPNTGGRRASDKTAQTMPIIPCARPGWLGAVSTGTAIGT